MSSAFERSEGEEATPALRAVQGGGLDQRTTAAELMGLQRTAGNRSVVALLRARRMLARAPKLPGFHQVGDTCGAASLVTALFDWDNERASPDNHAVVHACDLVLTNKDASGSDPVAMRAVRVVRDIAMLPGRKLGQQEYETLSAALAVLYHGRAGMSSSDINALAKGLGLSPFASGEGKTLSEILASDAVTKLNPGEVGQLNWIIANTNGGHAMLLGRHEDGTWFFSDQAPTPPKELQTATRADLVNGILAYARFGGWLYDGNKLDLPSIPPVTGFVAMGQVQRFLNRGPSIIEPGQQLAKVDPGRLSFDEVLTAWDYHSRWETLDDAKAAITKDSGGHGGVIVERPKGMFHVYKTNPIKDNDLLKVTQIDRKASEQMLLIARESRFLSIWLVLSNASGVKGPPFAVKP